MSRRRSLLALVLAAIPLLGAAAPTRIDLLDMQCQADVPTVSLSDHLRMYCDSGTARLMVSTNGGAYAPIGSGGGGSPGGTSGNLQINDGAGGFGAYGGASCPGGQFASSTDANGAWTCTTPAGGGDVTASGTLTNNQLVLGQGGTTVATFANGSGLLHAGTPPTWSVVASSDLNITPTTCTDQVITALSSSAAGTCSSVSNAMLSNSTIAVSNVANQTTVSGSPVALGGTVTIGAAQDIASTSSPSFSALSLIGTAGAGWLDLSAQSVNPPAPAAGTLRLHSATTNGFTRMEQDNEAPTNLVYGRDNVLIAHNTTAGTISKGQVVYITGSTGNVPEIGLAQANAAATMPAIGIALDSILTNNFGQIMTVGLLTSFNTSGFSVGDQLFVSPAVAGGLTKTRPSGTTNIVQRIGSVSVSGVGNGAVVVGVAPALQNIETGTNAATWTASAIDGTTLTLSSRTGTPATAATFDSGGKLVESSTLGFALGGTGLSSAADDTVMISNGTAWQAKTLPDCADSGGNHLNYVQSSNTFSCGTSGGGGAPTGASYWTAAAEAGLSNETNLGALTTGLILNTVTAGTAVPSTYAGTACTGAQVVQTLSASGVASCVTPSGSGTVTGTGTTGTLPAWTDGPGGVLGDSVISQSGAIASVNGSANALTLTGSATTAPVVVGASGSDTDVAIGLVPKGSGTVYVTNDLAGAVASFSNGAARVYVFDPTVDASVGPGGIYVNSTAADLASNSARGLTIVAETPGTQANNLAGPLGASIAAAGAVPTGKTLDSVLGLSLSASLSGAGSSPLTIGVDSSADVINTATATDVMVQRLRASKAAGATIGTLYGLKIEDMAGASTNYALYTGSGGVRFGGAVDAQSTVTVAGRTGTPATVAAFDSGGKLVEASSLGFGLGGTGLTAAADDTVMVSSGTAWQAKTVPDCADTGGNHLNYTQSSNTFSCGTSGGGAPTSASYWTSTSEAGLSSETNLGALTTGLLLNTVTAGTAVPSAYAGTTCTSPQFVQALDASGAATCATPAGSGTVTGTGTTGTLPIWTNGPSGVLGDSIVAETAAGGGVAALATTAGAAAITQGTITAAQPALETSSTWNNAGVTFSHRKSTVTATAYTALSRLDSIFVGTDEVFALRLDANRVTELWLNANIGGTLFPEKSLKWVGQNVLIMADEPPFDAASVHNVFINSGNSFNTTGSRSTFVGKLAGQRNSTGNDNIALGYRALNLNETGSNNIAIGNRANDGTGAANFDATLTIGSGPTSGIHGPNASNQAVFGSDEAPLMTWYLGHGSTSFDTSTGTVSIQPSTKNGSNKTAYDFQVAGARGTGVGVPGSVYLATSTTVGSGSGAQPAPTNRWQISGPTPSGGNPGDLLAVTDGAVNIGETAANRPGIVSASGSLYVGGNQVAGAVAGKLNAGMLAIASQAVGDLLYANGTTTFSRLADVAAGSYLRSGGVNTAPLWSTLTLPNAATTGDTLIATGANAVGVLPAVAAGSYMRSAGTGTAPVWSTLVLPNAATTGDLLTATSANTVGVIAAGTAGLVLTANGAGVASTYQDSAASTQVLTNKTFNAESTGNVLAYPVRLWLPAAGCNNTTAGTVWDLPTTTPAVAACVTGTNIQKGVLDFADSGPFVAQNTFSLDGTWTTTGGVDATILWTSSATTGDAIWNLQIVCTAVGGTAADDPAFPTVGNNGYNTVTTTVSGTTNAINSSIITGATLPTSCVTATPMLVHLRLSRDGTASGDTLGATARLIGVSFNYRRSI